MAWPRLACKAPFHTFPSEIAFPEGILLSEVSMEEQLLRTRMLLGYVAIARLQGAHVAVLGIAGVGRWCDEALARSGVGT